MPIALGSLPCQRSPGERTSLVRRLVHPACACLASGSPGTVRFPDRLATLVAAASLWRCRRCSLRAS
jgi:hypothetical protein